MREKKACVALNLCFHSVFELMSGPHAPSASQQAIPDMLTTPGSVNSMVACRICTSKLSSV